MRIFVVDDDRELLDLIARVLKSDGHTVVTASRGAEALQRALMEDFDLLLCDLMLPDLNGTEVIRALKAQSPDLPVIVISALAPSDWKEQCLDAGATGYLQKPLFIEDLRTELQLVQQGRAELTVWLVDADAIHRRRVQRELSGQGCGVHTWSEATEALADDARDGHSPSLLLVDARDTAAVALIQEAAHRGAAAMAFGEGITPDREDSLLRAGAAMCLHKPLDTAALLVQARFLTHA